MTTHDNHIHDNGTDTTTATTTTNSTNDNGDADNGDKNVTVAEPIALAATGANPAEDGDVNMDAEDDAGANPAGGGASPASTLGWGEAALNF